MERQEEIDLRYLRICREYSLLSRCCSRQVGALLVLPDYTPICMGVNGPPRGVPHCGELSYCPKCNSVDRGFDCGCGVDLERLDGRCPRALLGSTGGPTLFQCPAVHAEENAILTCARTHNPTRDCSMYIYPIGPCKDCVASIIQAGVRELIYPEGEPYDELSGWMLSHSGITIRCYPLEKVHTDF